MKRIALLVLASTTLCAQELHVDWSSIDTNQIDFPASFDFGVAYADYQVCGAAQFPLSNWAYFEKHSRKKIKEPSGRACDSWNQRASDIACALEVGATTMRISVEWAAIEPKPGVFDDGAINHYRDFCKQLCAAGIKPMVTLHHFVHPQWFDELGGFEKVKNSSYFVRYAQVVFEALHEYVPLWVTINEPGVYATGGYMRGVFPPAGSITKLGVVQKNLLRAHKEAYKKLKSLPGGDQAQIGIVHQLIQFEPYKKGNLFEGTLCYYLNHMFHQALFDFLHTGKFAFHVPRKNMVTCSDPEMPKSFDFIGLNYYSHVLVKFDLLPPLLTVPAYRPWEIATDMPYGIYAEGLLRAIATVSKLGVPIYITENGISDVKDDGRRDLYIKRYLYVVSQALKAGYDLRGYYYWSLLDNFEWDMGYAQKFGLYAVDFKTGKRTLRSGAEHFVKTAKNHRNKKI
jgi:beta-glucosidase